MDPFVFFLLSVPVLAALGGLAGWHNQRRRDEQAAESYWAEVERADEPSEHARFGARDLYVLAGGTDVEEVPNEPNGAIGGRPAEPECTCEPYEVRSFGGRLARYIHEPDCPLSPPAMKSMNRIDPWDQGRAAHAEGRSLADDPYLEDGESSNSWRRGWAGLRSN